MYFWLHIPITRCVLLLLLHIYYVGFFILGAFIN